MRYSGLILAALQSPLLDANNPYSLSHYRPPGAIPITRVVCLEQEPGCHHIRRR